LSGCLNKRKDNHGFFLLLLASLRLCEQLFVGVWERW
jgi:hypothetical protein